MKTTLFYENVRVLRLSPRGGVNWGQIVKQIFNKLDLFGFGQICWISRPLCD